MGLASLAQEWKKDGNTLILDGGDMLQGSAFAAFVQKTYGDAGLIARAVNTAGYDAVCIGNHDLNYGLDYLCTYLDRLDGAALCSNIRILGSGTHWKNSEIFTLENGVRVGVIGICTDSIRNWERPETLSRLEVKKPFDAVRQEIARLKPQCDLLVGLYHGGLEQDLETGGCLEAGSENVGCRLCRETELDILLTGHQHRLISGRIYEGTWVVQPGCRGQQYACVQVEISEHGEKRICSELCGASSLQNRMGFLKPVEAQVQAWCDQEVGRLNREILVSEHLDMAMNGSLLANLINQIQCEVTGAQLSATCLGNEVRGLGRSVTVRDLLAAYVFSNTLMVYECSGAQLKEYMEYAWRYIALDEEGGYCIDPRFLYPKVMHYEYDYFYGVTYEVCMEQEPGQRIRQLWYQGKRIRKEDRFSICVTNYRAAGGGGYSFIKGWKLLRDIRTEVPELMIRFFEENRQITVDERKWRIGQDELFEQ